MKAASRRFPCSLVRVVDGDTVVLRVESRLPGMVIHLNVHVRLLGINAPELPTPEGQASRAWLIERLAAGFDSVDIFATADKYGRWLGVLMDGDVSINREMVSQGLAKEFP